MRKSRLETGGYLGEEELAVEQVGQLNESLLHGLPAALRHVQLPPHWRLLVAGEEDALGVGAVREEGDA